MMTLNPLEYSSAVDQDAGDPRRFDRYRLNIVVIAGALSATMLMGAILCIYSPRFAVHGIFAVSMGGVVSALANGVLFIFALSVAAAARKSSASIRSSAWAWLALLVPLGGIVLNLGIALTVMAIRWAQIGS